MVSLPIQAYIPQDYIPDINQRLVIYRRLATVLSDHEIADLERELADRYGVLPLPVEQLLHIARLKGVLRRYLITAVDYAGNQLVFSFHEKSGRIACKNTFSGFPESGAVSLYSGS